jgi:hypothetical protein
MTRSVQHKHKYKINAIGGYYASSGEIEERKKLHVRLFPRDMKARPFLKGNDLWGARGTAGSEPKPKKGGAMSSYRTRAFQVGGQYDQRIFRIG